MQNNNDASVISTENFNTPNEAVFGSGNGVKAPKEKKPLPKKALILIGVFLVLALSAAGFFYYRFSKRISEYHPEDYVAVEYASPVDSEDPVGDYTAYLDAKADSAKTATEKIQILASKVSVYCLTEDYDSALAILKDIDVNSLETPTERWYYYESYARLYSENYLNDPALYAEYTAKAEEMGALLDDTRSEESENADGSDTGN